MIISVKQAEKAHLTDTRKELSDNYIESETKYCEHCKAWLGKEEDANIFLLPTKEEVCEDCYDKFFYKEQRM